MANDKMNKEVNTDEIKKHLVAVVNWKRVAQIIYKEATGGKQRINGNTGKKYRTAPNFDFMKLMLAYTIGLPTTTSDITIDNKNAATKLAEIIKNDMKERGVATVDASGKVDNLSTDDTVIADSDSKSE